MADTEYGSSAQKKEVLGTSFLKGFAAGIIVSHINKTLVVGLLVGAAAGIYVEQNYKELRLPNVADEFRRLRDKLRSRTSD